MSRFHRDDDLEFLGGNQDVTAGEQHKNSNGNSVSPLKQARQDVNGKEALEEAALASLQKRMAGPSSAKAGLSRDQDEINRRIYEASKGSKYFENEKRSDERITIRINKMLKHREEVLHVTPPDSEEGLKVERKIDERAIQLEASRDLNRIILHADMDMFYAAVELKRDPSLKGKAFGVGSGVLVTASYEARQFGVRSGMASHIAYALCPHLITVKNDMASYVAASKEVMVIFEEYDPDYAQMSLDEAYLDVTEYCETNQIGVDQVVEQLRKEVEQKTGLTVSVGIAPNKMLAKISSDRNKPNGQYRVIPDRGIIISLMQDLPCRKIPGIGRVTERELSSLGVETCGDIWTHRVMLYLVFRGEIDWLLKAYLGIHSNVVEPAKRGERRSVGREHTFQPTKDVAALKGFLKVSAMQVGKDLERLDYRGKTVTLTFKTDKFQRYTRAKTGATYKWKGEELYAITCELLDAEIVQRKGPFALRLIGVRLSNLKDMRVPEKGALEQLFKKGGTSKKEEQKEASPESEDDMDDYQKELQKALELSMDELEKKKETACGDEFQISECPVCQKSFSLKTHKDEVSLSAHVEACLSRIDQVSKHAVKPKAPAKTIKRGGPMDVFVSKKVKQN